MLLSLFTGDFGNLSLPSGTIQITIGLAVLAVASVAKRCAAAALGDGEDPAYPQPDLAAPRMALHPPKCLFAGAGGSVLMSVAFIACFGFAEIFRI